MDTPTGELEDRSEGWYPAPTTGEPQPQIPGVTFFVYKRDGSMEISTDPYRRDYVSYQDFTVAEARITELEGALEALATGVLRGHTGCSVCQAIAQRYAKRAALAGTPK